MNRKHLLWVHQFLGTESAYSMGLVDLNTGKGQFRSIDITGNSKEPFQLGLSGPDYGGESVESDV